MVITNKADIEIIGFYSTIMALVYDYDIIRKFIWIIEKLNVNYRSLLYKISEIKIVPDSIGILEWKIDSNSINGTYLIKYMDNRL